MNTYKMIEFLNDTEKNLKELESDKESLLQLESEIEGHKASRWNLS